MEKQNNTLRWYEEGKRIKETYQLRYRPDFFSRKDLALSFAKRCTKIHLVMAGEDGMYWVVCPSDAARLTRAGFEYAM